MLEVTIRKNEDDSYFFALADEHFSFELSDMSQSDICKLSDKLNDIVQSTEIKDRQIENSVKYEWNPRAKRHEMVVVND